MAARQRNTGEPRIKPRRPTRAEILAAAGRTLPDVIGKGLTVLFCGINPGLYTAAIGHHFGRPGNRFWPALHEAGFTPRLLDPSEERELLALGYGITNIVPVATATAAELTLEQLQAGAQELVRKVRRYRPRFLAIVGIDAYRKAFGRPKARPGQQPETIGEAWLWLLPNPSGLNAHYQRGDFSRVFRELHEAAHGTKSPGGTHSA